MQSKNSLSALLISQLDIDFAVASDDYDSTTTYSVMAGWCFSEIIEPAEGSRDVDGRS